jgi:bacterioferritin
MQRLQLENNIIIKLQEAMADEFLAMYQYFSEVRIIEQSNNKNSIIKELKQHAIEEYKHAGWLADRIHELGGTIITNPTTLYTYSSCGITEPKNNNSLQILEEALQGEYCAIKSYTNMAKIAKESGDIKTYDILMRIIQDEREHVKDLSELKSNISNISNINNINKLKG